MLGMVLSLAAAFPAHVEAGVAPALLLARSYDANVDVQRYWVSEKLDGIRAFWDGAQLLSRGGQQIHAPQWFIDGLPAQALDGELWMGRGHFDALSGTVRRAQPDEQAWRSVRFMIYEAPGAVGTFTERLQVIRERVALANGLANIPWLQAVEQFRVSDSRALQEQLQQITRAGGEGLMLHRADALYETGRSDALMKLKLWQDAEATIIGHQPGRGKYQGMLGALRVRSADGREFSLGSGLSDQQRRDPPPVGTVITYRFNDRTAKGQPRFARFWRISETAFDLAAER
jgi:DNA ligase-1